MEELEIFLEEEGGEEEITLESENVGGVIDVKVDGKSVVANGIANIDLKYIEETLQYILSIIEGEGSKEFTISELEELIISNLENKIIEEVEK